MLLRAAGMVEWEVYHHYVEVMDKDVIRFGLSSREYVLMLPPS
jgi:hypothetical protein